MTSSIQALSHGHEIVSRRVFAYPAEKVFRAWSDPALLQQWWGPDGFSNTFHEFDFKVGGQWRFTMHGPDKGHYENHCEFVEIVPPQLVSWKRYSKPLFHIVTTFSETASSATSLTFRMIFPTVDDCNKVKRFAIDKNEENFDRLEKVLADQE